MLIEVSDSQIKEFQRCPRRWAYTRLLKLTPEEDKDSLVLGNALHAGMEEYVLTGGDLSKAQAEVILKIKEGQPTDIEWELQVAPAMLAGWARHWVPKFREMHDFVKLEQWFAIKPHPEVAIRGFKDVEARRKASGGRVILDYKTTSQAGGGDLGKTISFNHQLALYACADRRETGTWPDAVGLVFLQKPKNTTIAACVAAANDPKNYFDCIVEVTPKFAAFALQVEASVVLYSQQMMAYRQAFEQYGLASLDYVPMNVNECFSYGRICGFAPGCHSGNPCHKTLNKPI